MHEYATIHRHKVQKYNVISLDIKQVILLKATCWDHLITHKLGKYIIGGSSALKLNLKISTVLLNINTILSPANNFRRWTNISPSIQMIV